MLLVECNVLEKVKVINEGTKGGPTRLRLQGKFQQCDEQNNNGRIYPKNILENQVKAIQEKICDRSLVGALDHPNNDAIHLSQASHLITKLWLEKDGSVMGECEILSTPNGKIVEALINDGVKIGISSRGVGSVTEGIKGKIVNEDFKLITFDLVSDPSTRGAFPELTESIRENSQRAQEIVSKHKKDRVLLTMLESKISKALKGKRKKLTPKQRKNIDLTEPFGVITSSDLKAVGEAQEPDEHDRSSAGDDGAGVQRKVGGRRGKGTVRVRSRSQVKPMRAKVTRKRYDPKKAKRRTSRDVHRSETLGEAKSRVRGRNVKRKIATLPKTIRVFGKRPNPNIPSDLQVIASRRQPTGADAPERVKAAAQRDEFMQDAYRAGQGPKPVRLQVRRRPKSENSSTIIDRFGDIIRERCWKGYEITPGVEPYAKGSCRRKGSKKVRKSNSSTEIEGNSLSEVRGKRAYQRVMRAQRAAQPSRGHQKPWKASEGDLRKASKYGKKRAEQVEKKYGKGHPKSLRWNPPEPGDPGWSAIEDYDGE